MPESSYPVLLDSIPILGLSLFSYTKFIWLRYARSFHLTDLDYKHKHTKQENVHFICLLHCPEHKTL